MGLQSIFLDDELVAYSWQEGRRCDTTIEFTSIEAAKKVFDFMLPKFENVKPSIVSSAETIEPFYTVTYSSQLIVDEGFYKGNKVKVVERYGLRYERDQDWHAVKIEHEDGTQEVIQMVDFKIPLHITAKAEDDIRT